MSRGTVNKVILVGRLGADPEIRYTAAGSAVANVSLATNETWKDKQTGEFQERTEWHRVVMFTHLAERAGEYLRKGSQIYVEGNLRTQKWQDQSGQDRWTTEIVARDMQMLGGRDDANANYAPSGGGQNHAPPSQAPASPQQTAPSGMPAGNKPPAADFDDDIPF